MIKIAIVEDEKEAADGLKAMLAQYAETRGRELETVHFGSAVTFLTNYRSNFDIVFMDIELPGMNGMKAAQKLRQADENVAIIFVTNMSQYALGGYKVGALDFVVKPVVYNHLEQVMDRACRLTDMRKNEPQVVVMKNDKLTRISVFDIRYVEIVNHTLHYHRGGEVLTISGSLTAVEKQLQKFGFARCNSCYLVNLRYVTAVDGFTVVVDGRELQMSHPRRKKFMQSLTEFLGGMGGG